MEIKKTSIKVRSLLLVALCTIAPQPLYGERAPRPTVNEKTQEALGNHFSKARIEVTDLIKTELAHLIEVKILSISPKGEAEVQCKYTWDTQADDVLYFFKNHKVSFKAWIQAPVSIKRIHPGEKLSPEFFKEMAVNIATGVGYEYRGVIVHSDAALAATLEGTEARNSILEGSFLLSTSLQKSPEVRRGDLVKIELSSGDLLLGTGAVAQEPGFIGQNIRVLINTTKKEITGKLKSRNVVEISL